MNARLWFLACLRRITSELNTTNLLLKQNKDSDMRTNWKCRSRDVPLALQLLMIMSWPNATLAEEGLNLTHATLVVRSTALAPLVQSTAATVLIEEVEKRSGVKWSAGTDWPSRGWSIVILSGQDMELHGRAAPKAVRINRAEGYGMATD